jgi:23S rRNA (adenine-N6)-dimethyltransferase
MVYHDKSSLSQNFIKYQGLVNELIEVSDINSDDCVIEIGPGKGIITQKLAGTAKNIIAIEKDKDLADQLISEFKGVSNVKIINRDFLDYFLPGFPYKVFSNIPFSITAEIIAKFLKSPQKPDSMYLIMQQEAAEKFVGNPIETQSSILTKPWYEIEILGDIDRTNFLNKPQVRIVFVKFKKRAKSFIDDLDTKDFRDFVIYGFSQWQPTIIDAYKKIFSENQFKIAQKTLKLTFAKPTETNFDTWLGLFKMYKRFVSDDKKNIVRDFERKYQK